MNEMEINLPRAKTKANQTRRKRAPKPWWNNNPHLNTLWCQLVIAERTFLAMKGPCQRKRLLRCEYVLRQKTFDRAYNKAKRAYHKEQQDNLLNLDSENPKEFWNQIKRLGPRPRNDIPMCVRCDDGSMNTNIHEVLLQWETDFHDLYNAKQVNAKENNCEINMAVPTSLMNEMFTRDEILKVVAKAKKGKAMGPDNIPYDVLKSEVSIDMLTILFNKCYSSGYVPSLWTRAYIKPIPKGNNMDKFIPTNYRGISLLSCIGKLYSSVINSRLLGFLETHNMLVDEQNGFRSTRACVDHLYSLTSIIRNIKLMNKDTLVCFIDMAKAFDHLNRTLMFNKLAASISIGANMYSAIRGLYHNTMSRIALNHHFTDYFEVLSGVKQGDTLSMTIICDIY